MQSPWRPASISQRIEVTMQHIDGSEISVAIDLDQGARISSLLWCDMQITVPFRGGALTHGMYGMGPWAGRIRDGLIKDNSGNQFELPNNLMPIAINHFPTGG